MDVDITPVVESANEGLTTGDSAPRSSLRAAAKSGQPARLHVAFSPEAYARLQEMAVQRGKTIAQTVQDALSLDLWVEAQMQAGNRILVEQRDGSVYTAIKPAPGD